MMNTALTGKTILIISPQSWGKMFISKHHYAIELARRGNKVFFLNPPEEKQGTTRISILPSGLTDNLFLVNHNLWFPYWLKFHALPLFHWLMQFHIKKLLAKTGTIEVLWSFDLGNLYPFRLWGQQPYKVFHPVDEPLNQVAIESGKGADIIFSVTQEILQKYSKYPAPKHFINHGVSEDFLQTVEATSKTDQPVRIGFAGNLLRTDIDRSVFLRIVQENPAVIFECWGSYTIDQSNIGGSEDVATRDFIKGLQVSENVVLHGPVSSAVLAKAIHEMDAFLICYDVQKDQSKGTNYHKIIEFLSTGKVIIANNVTTYKDQPDLLQMVAERDNNDQLPALFKEVIDKLAVHNGDQLQQKRKLFAQDNTYTKQLERIDQLLYVTL